MAANATDVSTQNVADLKSKKYHNKSHKANTIGPSAFTIRIKFFIIIYL